MTWEGKQLAVACNRGDGREYQDYVTERTLRDVAREMAPTRFEPAHRVAYAWQVEEFDPAEHVVIRYWCRRNNVDIVDFWRGFYPPVQDELSVVETTNPELAEEMAEGSYSPTRRCMLRSQLYLARNHFLGTSESAPAPAQPEPAPAPPQPRAVHDSQDSQEEQVQWRIHDGAQAYSPHEVLPALESALERLAGRQAVQRHHDGVADHGHQPRGDGALPRRQSRRRAPVHQGLGRPQLRLRRSSLWRCAPT